MTDLLAAYRLKCLELGIPVLESDSPDRREVREGGWGDSHIGTKVYYAIEEKPAVLDGPRWVGKG